MKFKEGDKIQIVRPFMRMGQNHVGSVGEVIEYRCYSRCRNQPTHYVIKFDCYKRSHIYMTYEVEDSCELIKSE